MPPTVVSSGLGEGTLFLQGWPWGEMSYGHGPSIANLPAGKPPKSAFMAGTHVVFTTGDGRRLYCEVVGPDQAYFPSPRSVFVSFPATGFMKLLYVTDLEIVKCRVR